MKHIRLTITLAALVLFASCKKDLTTDSLSFGVTTASKTYNVGDTIRFNFTGNPDFISFFSGEAGHDYQYRERTTIDGVPQLQFTTYAQYGAQTNTLQLLVSNDFKQKYTAAGIAEGTWTDITSRATLSTGADNTASGIIDLSDFLAQKKPIHIAFKYTGEEGSTQKTWTITKLKFDLKLADNSLIPITDIATAGWKGVNVLNPAAVWSIAAAQLRMSGGNAAAASNEDWAVTKLLYLNSVLPDYAVAIKNVTEKVDSYDFVYSKPGTYKVVFLAANATGYEQQYTTKEVELTIQ